VAVPLLESVEAEVVEAAPLAGEEVPAGGIGGEVSGVCGEDRRGVVLRIDREGDQGHIGRCGGGQLEVVHLRAHHGARTGAGGVDEVSHPDVAVERLAAEWLPGLSDELERRNLPQHWQRLWPGRWAAFWAAKLRAMPAGNTTPMRKPGNGPSSPWRSGKAACPPCWWPSAPNCRI